MKVRKVAINYINEEKKECMSEWVHLLLPDPKS